MTDGFRKDTVTFEIVANIGKAGKREVNMVSWNGRAPKVDIREWDEYHDTPRKGITMTDAEAKELYEALKTRYGNEG